MKNQINENKTAIETVKISLPLNIGILRAIFAKPAINLVICNYWFLIHGFNMVSCL